MFQRRIHLGKTPLHDRLQIVAPTGSPRDSAAEKSAIIVDFVDRVKFGSLKISTVET